MLQRRSNAQRGRAATDVSQTLAHLRAGDRAVIAEIPDDRARAQATRFGMGAGATVRCETVVPGGPVVLRCGRQEIAVGRALATRIRIAVGDGVVRECA